MQGLLHYIHYFLLVELFLVQIMFLVEITVQMDSSADTYWNLLGVGAINGQVN